jgi:hypothetical protein
MARSSRAAEAGGLNQVLNHTNFGAKMFRQEGAFAAFEKVLHEAARLDKFLSRVIESTNPLPIRN